MLALTDHDTVAGVTEAAEAAGRHGIRLAPAVEISAMGPAGRDLHLLGYMIDPRAAALRELLERSRRERSNRAEIMAAALRELGFELDQGPLRSRAEQGKPIGRPHLAQAVVAHPANAGRLAREGFTDPSAFLEAYLIPGRPGFRPRPLPSIASAISAIHGAGGVSVWAHPFWDLETSSEVLENIDGFRSESLDGVECFYPTHTREQANLLADRCEELGMLSTGSSDFHGPNHRGFSGFRAFSTHGRTPALGPIAA